MTAKKLILESDVRAMARGARLVLAPGDIATPAALDEAHERGVSIVRGERVAAGAKPGGKDCLWHKILASPGKYVVEVANGEAIVWLLAEQGPVAFGRDRLENHS